MIALLLATLLSMPAQAQEAGGFNLGSFCGMQDADTPATLPPCASPDLLNVEANLDGTAILKRKGFSKFADLTYATSSVSGSHSFIDSSGNRLDVVCHDRHCGKSTNGNAFANFLSSAGGTGAVPKRWSFVDVGGILYGANDKRDPILKYDGATLSYPAGMPAGSILELTQDRLAVADIASLPNRVHYSSSGAFEQFTTGVNPEDSFFDDIGAAGDRVRGIKCIQGNCFIFKTASITLCEMGNQYNTSCSVISPVIGTTDPASIVAAGSTLYFRAQDKNYWEIDRGGLAQISKKIPNLVKSQSGGFGGGEMTNTQTTQADWQAGAQVPSASFNTDTIPGSIFPSSVTLLDTTDANFSSGTFNWVSTWTTAGYIVSSSSNAAALLDNFSDQELTSSPAWTLGFAGWTTGRLNFNGQTVACGIDNGAASIEATESNGIRTAGGINYGRWEVNVARAGVSDLSGSGVAMVFKFIQDPDAASSGDGYWINLTRTATPGTFTLNLYKRVRGTSSVMNSATITSFDFAEMRKFSIVRSTAGIFTVYDNTTAVIISTSSELVYSNPDISVSGIIVNAGCSDPYIGISSVSIAVYASTGHFISRVFDTGFSTTTGGTFTVSSTVPTGTTLAFAIHSASSPSGVFGAYSAITNGAKIAETQRYWQYVSSFTTIIGTQTAQIADVSLIAATTGQFRTQCIQPNASITSWGTLSCAESKVGGGSLVYYATSAVSCATLSTTTPVNFVNAVQDGWTAQTNNATVTIATNSAVYIGWRSLLGSATDQAQVDACVLAWNDGTPSQPSWAVYDSVKNAVYWTATVNGHSSTNRLLKYDRNMGEWFPWDIPAQAPRIINNTLYFGGASSGTWNTHGLVDADGGSAIRAYWKSKDFGSDRPFNEKDFQTASVLTRNNGAGILTGTWTNSIGATGTWDISLSTGAGIVYARSLFRLPKKSPQQFMSIQLGNNSAMPFEVLGLSVGWAVVPWKVP